MKNSDMPAMPFEGGSNNGMQPHSGLTKREIFAMHAEVQGLEFNSISNLSNFIGRHIDENSPVDLIKAGAECDAKLRLIYADALLSELEKQQ